MLKVHFERENRTIQVEPGENLRKAAIRNKFSVYSHIYKVRNCRGLALSNSCTVEIIAVNVAPRNEAETGKLAQTPPDYRLAWQITVDDDLIIKTHP